MVLLAKFMCREVVVFCWEHYGWGTEAFFDPSATVYNDGTGKTNHFANLRSKPESEHCLLEEALWLREMRDEGLLEYKCGNDTTTFQTELSY